MPAIFQLSQEKTTAEFQQNILLSLIDAENELKNLQTEFNKDEQFLPKSDFNNTEKSFFIFEQDSLIFWTDDQSEINFPILNNPHNVIETSNAIYLKSTLKANKNSFHNLNLIQFNYPITNKYLQNTFAQLFNFSSIKSICLENGEQAITNNEGEIILYLNFQENRSSAIVVYFFVFLLFISFYFILFIVPFDFQKVKPWLSISLAITIRLVLFFYTPSIFENLKIYQTKWFAINSLIPSLADLLFHCLLLFFVFYQLRKHLRVTKSKLLCVFFTGFSILFTCSTIWVIENSVESSQINFDFTNLFNLNYLSIISFFCYAILIMCNLLLFDLTFKLSERAFNRNSLKKFGFIFLTGCILLPLFLINSGFLYSWGGPLVLLFWLKSTFPKKINLLVILVLLTYSSAVVSYSMNLANENKTQLLQKSLINSLAEERDPVAEYLFDEVQQKLFIDTTLINGSDAYWKNKDDIDNYLIQNYFNGYWDKYQINFVICDETDNLLLTGNESNCWDHFDKRIRTEGRSISSSNLFQLNNYAGRIDYIGEIQLTKDSTFRRLLVELSSIYLNENEGYPELLLDEKTKGSSISLDGYSFAVYNNKKLVYKSGDYNYSTRLKISELNEKNYYQYPSQFHEHLAFQKDKEVTILLSRNLYGLYDFLTTLAYLLVIISLMYALAAFALPYFPFHIRVSIHDFSTKIQVFLIGSILVSLILLAWGTSFYIEKQYQVKNESSLNEKIRSVNIELESKIGQEEFLAKELTDYVTNYLVKFSNVFYSDINLYTTSGNLYATSRAELFEKGIKSKRMNPQALYALDVENKAQWTQQEQIGELNYLSAYIPFKNFDNEVIGYLNLPYFAKQDALEKEISTFLVSTLNIYVGIFALALLISVLLINQLSKPLLLIRQQISKLKLGSSIELIEWNSKDEIGALVQEYNRIAIELNESAEELAKNEREVAWREMAKQVAHEIKNPLTPMKLSIQHLQRSASMDSEDLKERIDRTSKTLVEQIETLSNIATAFSSFAKLPGKKLQKVDLLPLLHNAADLYSHSLTIPLELPKELATAIVMGDKDQLLRVFNNLIKNAVQATESNESPEISIDLELQENNFLIHIKDNGVGISIEQANRIFEPNFTTKSSGTGLGLAMSKSIVDHMNGRITFESVEKVGTTFIIELPKA